MNMVIDAGNTRTKVGIFEGALMRQIEVFASIAEAKDFVRALEVENLIISSVTDDGTAISASANVRRLRLSLTPSLPVPIQNRYATPQTLGADRLAAACGAWSMYPGENSLVIDFGTCINYEFVNARGEYMGGAISPGVAMRFQAMHQMTARLPLGESRKEFPLTGSTTMECLESGVMNGIREEINGLAARYKSDCPGIRVILTGGDSHFFEKLMNPPIFVAPDLVLTGLNSILLHNARY
jgi:type III pantothenate kinase